MRQLAWQLSVGTWILSWSASLAGAAESIDFNRDVRPILSDKCFACHGPDAKNADSDLRLDLREQAIAGADEGEAAIVPGKPEASERVRRIYSEDADERMPPADSHQEVQFVRRIHRGRDHHGRCLTTWLAGACMKRGFEFGKTDEYAYNIVENPVHINDLNATILHNFGIDHKRLTYKYLGLDQRLTGVEDPRVVHEVFA